VLPHFRESVLFIENEWWRIAPPLVFWFYILKQLPIKRNTRNFLKALLCNAFKKFLDLSAKRYKKTGSSYKK